MPPPIKSTSSSSDHHHRSSSRESDDDEMPSKTLWVGNLSSDTDDADLIAVFSKYHALDSTASRNYAFIYFMHVDDARAAKDALQAVLVRGNPIKIQFARPAKPGKQIWIGGISPSVTKEQLEDEFSKFGKIEDYKYLRDRNSALIDYYKIEDAVAAMKSMNGKRLGGEQIRVDFLRSQNSRRDWPDHDSRDGHVSNRRNMPPPESRMPPDGMRNFHDYPHHGPKRNLPHGGRREEGQPSNVLWIGHPPSVRLDEQMLHNAMILFGEIERIKSFPSRNYSFVEFRSVDEARRAKEGLQGRLFNDPRIQILFSSSGLAPHKDNPPIFPGFIGPGPDIFFNEAPFGPLEFFGAGRPMPPNSFPGSLLPNAIPGPNMLVRPFAPRGFDPRHGGLEFFHDFGGGAVPNFPDVNVNNPMAPNWTRLSPPAPGMFPSAPGMRPPLRPVPGVWDGYDTRESKRSRIDSPTRESPFHARRLDGEGFRDPLMMPHPDRGSSGQSHLSPVVRGHGERHGSPDIDHCWRGVIAKGGSPVCRARCVPIGTGIVSPFPEIVNCSARTGLDMLTKHYAEASGFDIVFFLPDSEEDFASYTEFLRYLGLKNRAGVAKFDDGTTLFLVPPSDFLSKVLKVSGPDRLYGVVLNMLQQSGSASMQQPQAIPPPPSHYIDRQQVSTSQKGYNFVPQNEDQVMDYNRSLHEDSMLHAGVVKPQLSHADESRAMQSAPMDYLNNPAATSQVEVSLTPELIATLASLIPTSNQSSATGAVQMPSSSSVRQASFPASGMPDRSMPLQGWRQDQSTVSWAPQEQMSHVPQHLAHQFSNQASHVSQFPTYTNMANGPDHSAQSFLNSSQIQDPSFHMQQAAAIPTRPLNSYVIPSQGAQFSASQSNQQYQLDSSFSSHESYGMLQATDAAGMFHPPVQQPKPNSMSAHVQIANIPQPQIVMSIATDKVNTELPAQVQQLQTALSGSAQGTSEGDADKNQRYQSTLQFAANLLLQIQQQQQQQQASSHAVQGSANQQ